MRIWWGSCHCSVYLMLTCITFNCPLPGTLHPCPARVFSSTCQSHGNESRNNTSVQGPPGNSGGLWLSLKLIHLGVSALQPMCGEWCVWPVVWRHRSGSARGPSEAGQEQQPRRASYRDVLFQWKCLLLARYLKAWSQLAASAAKWELISPVGNAVSIGLWLWYFLMAVLLIWDWTFSSIEARFLHPWHP